MRPLIYFHLLFLHFFFLHDLIGCMCKLNSPYQHICINILFLHLFLHDLIGCMCKLNSPYQHICINRSVDWLANLSISTDHFNLLVLKSPPKEVQKKSHLMIYPGLVCLGMFVYLFNFVSFFELCPLLYQKNK